MTHFTGAAQSPYSFGNTGIKRAEESLKAVGPADRDYWQSKSGVSYMEEQISALSRGVQVMRIFLNPLDALIEMQDVMEEQQKAGVKVFVAIRDEIPKELHGGYIIMDNKLVNQAEFTGSGRIKQWKMSIDKFEVEQMVRQFDILLRRSMPLNVFLTTHTVQENKTE